MCFTVAFDCNNSRWRRWMNSPCYGRRFLSSFSHLFWGIKYLLVTSLPFSPSVLQVLLLCETTSVKLLNASDFSAVPVLLAKVVALTSLPPWLGKSVGKHALLWDYWGYPPPSVCVCIMLEAVTLAVSVSPCFLMFEEGQQIFSTRYTSLNYFPTIQNEERL